MENEVKVLKNNSGEEKTDLEWIEEFYLFLQGHIPDNINIGRGHKLKLSPKKAMSIIWYVQEHFSLLPDTIEKCDNCNNLFDRSSEGIYWESKGKFYCGGCDHLVPKNYDRGKR